MEGSTCWSLLSLSLLRPCCHLFHVGWAAQATWEQELQQDWHFPICHVLIHGRVINWIMGSTSLPMNTANIIPGQCFSPSLCVKMRSQHTIQTPKCNITAPLPTAVQLVFINQTAANVTHGFQKHQIFKQLSASTPKSHSLPRAWVTRPHSAATNPTTPQQWWLSFEHRGNTTEALQLRSLLGPPDTDMLTVWIVFLTSISATGSCRFTQWSGPNLLNFKELHGDKTTP